MIDLHSSLALTLTDYEKRFGETQAVRDFRLFASRNEKIVGRDTTDGHLTASTIVIDRQSRTGLRVFHAKLKCWVYTSGGHIEAGEMPWQAAERELAEEVGITTAIPVYGAGQPLPLILQSHPIPESPRKNEGPHRHYDMVYLFIVDGKPSLTPDPSEITEMKWQPIESIEVHQTPHNLSEQIRLFGHATI